MTLRNPMPPANKAAIRQRMRTLYRAECTDAEAAASLQPLWPNVTANQVHGLAVALELKSTGLKAPQPTLRRFSWEGDSA